MQSKDIIFRILSKVKFSKALTVVGNFTKSTKTRKIYSIGLVKIIYFDQYDGLKIIKNKQKLTRQNKSILNDKQIGHARIEILSPAKTIKSEL